MQYEDSAAESATFVDQVQSESLLKERTLARLQSAIRRDRSDSALSAQSRVDSRLLDKIQEAEEEEDSEEEGEAGEGEGQGGFEQEAPQDVREELFEGGEAVGGEVVSA